MYAATILPVDAAIKTRAAAIIPAVVPIRTTGGAMTGSMAETAVDMLTVHYKYTEYAYSPVKEAGDFYTFIIIYLSSFVFA